jgi:AcrR family transcriptional regulator
VFTNWWEERATLKGDHMREHRQRHEERRAERHERRAARHDGGASRRERRHSETRDEILAAAREVLAERGAADLSLREIARRADFSPAALYKYFDNKDEVIGALADGAMRALVASFAAAPPDLPPDRRAVELGMLYLAFSREHPADVAVIEVHESTTHPHPLTGDHAALEEAVIGVFRDGVTAGVFAGTEQDAEMMAYGAWALVQGLARFERVQRPAVSNEVKAHQRDLLTIYVNGLKTDRTPEG